ncbi:MAG: DUF302 domain-containing protein [Chloroflexi bacterium]|nr:DUF302 domain-containing protein [Chloroflexota bacterium]
MEHIAYGRKIFSPLDFETAVEKTVEALKANGFGVLTEIDVKATLKTKIGEEFRKYVILGACNPKLAFRGLSAEDDLGLLLPCNVIVYEDGDGSVIAFLDPSLISSLTANTSVGQVAREAEELLDKAMQTIEAAGAA